MRRYFLERVLGLLATVAGIAILVFFIIRLIPGNPVDLMLGENARRAEKEAMRHALGLDQPISAQFLNYVTGLMSGNWGMSLHSRQPVLGEILKRWPATFELAAVALLSAAIIALGVGTVAAARRNTAFDRVTLAASFVGGAVPNFWLGPMLIIVFSIWFGWFPVSGREGYFGVVLPSITLGTGMAAHLLRLTRSAVLETLSEDFIRSARARGLPEWQVYGKHALSNALLPVVTLMGLQMGALLSGAVITESIFAWPGAGRLMVEAIEARDYPLVQGCVLTIAFCYVTVNFLTDIISAVVDPRIRLNR